MIFEYLPQLRDADENGLIGVRGYLNFFQDVATRHIKLYGKGNDEIPGKYGVAWMYTKYKLELLQESDLNGCFNIETWLEKEKTTAVFHRAMVVSKNGVVYAKGRLESCLINLKRGHLTKHNEIEFPLEILEERHLELAAFNKLDRKEEGLMYAYSYKVRYSDLDGNRHMTNLRYIPVMMDAFGSDFYDKYCLSGIELNYVSQCFEGEELKICSKKTEDKAVVFVLHSDASVAALAHFDIKER